MLYEREVEKINSKTKKIQEQDRALELQINQLDTEQNAIQTEMDSVSKIIEDNIDRGIGMFKLENGKNIVFAHGHRDSTNTALQHFVSFYYYIYSLLTIKTVIA